MTRKVDSSKYDTYPMQYVGRQAGKSWSGENMINQMRRAGLDVVKLEIVADPIKSPEGVSVRFKTSDGRIEQMPRDELEYMMRMAEDRMRQSQGYPGLGQGGSAGSGLGAWPPSQQIVKEDPERVRNETKKSANAESARRRTVKRRRKLLLLT